MEKEKLCCSTLDHSEIVVDYKQKKTDIIGTPDETIWNRLPSAAVIWFPIVFFSFLGTFVTLNLIDGYIQSDLQPYNIYIISLSIIIYLFLILLHLNKNFDQKIKKRHIISTGKKNRNKIKITDFKSKEFVLYDIQNIIVEFEADGDVSAQLNKIWIKKEHPSASIRNQSILHDMLLLDNEPKWNVYFIFDDIPKNGYLYVEWI